MLENSEYVSHLVLEDFFSLNDFIGIQFLDREVWERDFGSIFISNFDNESNSNIIYLPFDINEHELIDLIEIFFDFDLKDNLEKVRRNIVDQIILNLSEEDTRKPEFRKTLFKLLFRIVTLRGLSNILNFMKFFSQDDIYTLSINNSNFSKYLSFIYKYSDKDELITSILNLETLKNSLEAARQSNNISYIVQTEKRIIDRIIKKINLLPRVFGDNISLSSSPIGIIYNREIICAGKSFIVSALLLELGIKFNLAAVPKHSSVIVHLSDGTKVYYDSTWYSEFFEISDNTEENGFFKTIEIDGEIIYFREVNNIDGLISILLQNIGCEYSNNGDYERSIVFSKSALFFNEENPDIWFNIGLSYFSQGNYELSIQYLKNAFNLNNLEEYYKYLFFSHYFVSEKENILDIIRLGIEKFCYSEFISYMLILFNNRYLYNFNSIMELLDDLGVDENDNFSDFIKSLFYLKNGDGYLALEYFNYFQDEFLDSNYKLLFCGYANYLLGNIDIGDKYFENILGFSEDFDNIIFSLRSGLDTNIKDILDQYIEIVILSKFY